MIRYDAADADDDDDNDDAKCAIWAKSSLSIPIIVSQIPQSPKKQQVVY